MSSSTTAISSDVAELKDMVRALLLDKKNQSSAPAHSHTPTPVKAVEPNYVIRGGAHSYQNCPATSENVYRDDIQEYVSQAATKNYNQGNTSFQPQMVNQPPAYQAPAYQAPIPQPQSVSKTDFESYVKANYAVLRNMQTKDQVQTPSSQSTTLVQPPVVRSETQTLVSEPIVAPVSAPMPNLKPSIPYPSRRDNERRRDQANEQIEKFYEIFRDMIFEISFTDALILMPKFVSTLKTLTGNKEKLSEMARTSMNERCSVVILNKLPRKLRDPGKFLIPCEFPGMDECLALADLGVSINLMPLSMWEGLSLPKLTSTCMTLKLVVRSVSKPIGIAKDVSVKTGRVLIDVHKCELTLRIGNEAITYNLDQTSRYSANYNQMIANKINVIDIACEEYSQEILSFSDVTASGNPTLYDDPIVSTTSPTLTPFGDSDFLLFEETNAFLGLEDDPNLPKINPFYHDPEGDILLLEAILNSEPLPPLPNHEQYMPSFKKELKVCEAKIVKSFIDEPPEVKLKDLPPHLEYAFLEGDNKFPVIIAKELGDEEKSALIKDYKPVVQHQRRVNPKIHDVIKKEVEKLLDAGLIYQISDSPWVSLIHCVHKKGGFTVVENEENELIPTRLVTGWRVCIDYRKLNEATRKDHFPLPFMDQMLERLAGNEYYCFLDGFSGYFQIPIDPHDQEKTTFTCPYGTFAYRRMPFGLCNAPGTFQRCMLAIFHDMVEKTMEVFMDDFSVFGNSFENCISRLDKMLQRCENTNLCLNWEKSHFMVKEGIFLSHKISKNGIEINKAKVDVIAKLPHPTTVKVLDTKGAENLTADHLSRLENPYENVLNSKEINETFSLETLSMVTFRGDSSTPWFADFANYHAGSKGIVKDPHSSREEDRTSKTIDPHDLLGSLLLKDIDLIILGCDPLALVDGFILVKDNACLLETRVTTTNLSLELLMLGQYFYKWNNFIPKTSFCMFKPPRSLGDSCGHGPFFDNHIKGKKMVFKFLQTRIHHAYFRKFFRNLDSVVANNSPLFLRIVSTYSCLLPRVRRIPQLVVSSRIARLRLVVEIKSFGDSSDDFDKETVSFDKLQLKQADLSCVHALSELHLLGIRVVP
nr:reverse transcriptase domain-containing protein [Tanacetum cinerariifolium]